MNKEEKLAEEYFRTTYPAYIGCDKFTEDIKDAVIYGIEAGRPKWHDLRKNPTDVPKEEGEYLVCYETEGTNYRNTFILKYEEYDDSLHWCDETFETFDEGVVAWCEKPQYTEQFLEE